MIKKIDIAGIQLDNYSARECVMAVERMLSENTFHTVEEVNMDMIMLAASDDAVSEALNRLDCSIIAEKGILDVVGDRSIGHQETYADDCFYEILRRLERNHKSLFLLAEGKKQLQEMEQFLEKNFARLTVAGMVATEEFVEDEDAIVNEINAATIDVILSVMPSPKQEHFLANNRGKMSAILWYGVGNCKFAKKKYSLLRSIQKRIRIYKLENHIRKYEKQGEEK